MFIRNVSDACGMTYQYQYAYSSCANELYSCAWNDSRKI